MTYHTGVFIGRFQPIHNGHLFVIKQALEHCEQLVIMLGSSFRASTVKNPFSVDERRQLIHDNLVALGSEILAKRVIVEPIEDTMYHETVWINRIRQAAEKHAQGAIAIIGHDKDASTYYLKHFPDWDRIELPNFNNIDATHIRHAWLQADSIEAIGKAPGLPAITQTFLADRFDSKHYHYLREEHQFLQHYRGQWQHTPYPVLFNTTDALVLCQDHILLIQRKHAPGKDLWALPGGFVEAGEWLKEGIIRELIEETSIAIDVETLHKHLVRFEPFDHPSRSQIGRVITHAGLFKLPGALPNIKAADDALNAQWLPLPQLIDYREKLHDDHYYIINTLLELITC